MLLPFQKKYAVPKMRIVTSVTVLLYQILQFLNPDYTETESRQQHEICQQRTGSQAAVIR